MNDFPDTRNSLLVQIRDPANRDAWERFVQIYHPVIVRTALARGLQHADAHDLAQQVLMAVAKAVGSWEKRESSTRFRHWLARITRNAILNALMRRPKDRAAGSSAIDDLLKEVEEPDGPTSTLIESEYRRELYLKAAQIVKLEYRPESWRAFEMSVSGEQSIEQVAEQLGKSTGAVYTARSRIMFRLREVVKELEENEA